MSNTAKAIAASVLAAFLFGSGWLVNGWRLTGQLAQLKQERAEQTTRNTAAALHRYTEMERQKNEAIQAHAKLVAENAAAADAARDAADGLRRDLATVPARITASTRAAVDEYAGTAGELLGTCTARYTELARQADGHAADARLMLEAWPK